MGPDTIKTLWGSGFVNRWHSHPDARLRNAQDTTAAHAQRVAILLAGLFDVGLLDVLDALLHDAPECFTGDAPSTPKRAGLLSTDKAETAWWRAVGVRAPAGGDMLRLCDHIDATLFVLMHAPEVLLSDGWAAMLAGDLALAEKLGVRAAVEALIYG
jgi:hypothetical protein